MTPRAAPTISPAPKSSVRPSIFFCPCPNNKRSICIDSIYRLHQGGNYDAEASSNARESYPTSQMMNKMHILCHITRLWHLQTKQQHQSSAQHPKISNRTQRHFVGLRRFTQRTHRQCPLLCHSRLGDGVCAEPRW